MTTSNITRLQIDDLAKNDPKTLLDMIDACTSKPPYENMAVACMLEKAGEVPLEYIPRARKILRSFLTLSPTCMQEGAILGLTTIVLEHWDEEDVKQIELCTTDIDPWIQKIAIEAMEYIKESAAWRR